MAAAADDNDDCEVIFQNSPLYWSMMDAGLEDIGQQDVHSISHTSSPSNSGCNAISCDKFLWSRLWKGCLQEFTSLLSLRHENKTQVKEMHRQVFETLTRSTLLTEEDDQFLHDLKAEQQQKETTSALHTSSRKRWAVFCTAVIGPLLWALSPWRPFPTYHPWESVVTSVILALLLPLLLTRAAKGWHGWSFRRRGDALQESTGRVLRAAVRWSDVSAKCVRFIQESELVARGFTFVGKPGSIGAVRELQGTSTQRRQCPLLRKTLFLDSRSAFFSWRRSFACLVQLCPVKLEVSGVTHYCSEIPLSQYPAMLQQDGDGELDEAGVASLRDMSDDFSIDVLKSLQELNSIHMSEFLRRLAVCFVDSSEEADLGVSIPPLLDAASHDLERLCVDLQSCLTAHRRGSASVTSKSGKSRAWQPPSSASQLRSTYTAVHSLELHLLAALKKIQDLSESMEKTLDEEENQNRTSDQREAQDAVDDPVRDSWQRMLTTIRSELGACSGCLEEGLKQLERKDAPECSVAGIQPKAPAPAISPCVNVVRVSAQDNPIIMDEVFEAYSEPQDYDSRRGHSELTASEEEVWQRKQKNNLKQCLNELQSIIDVRAAQRQERERIAMDRMKCSPTAAHAPYPPHDNGDDHIDPEERRLVPDSIPEWDLEKKDGAEQCESAEDLAKDVAERVEFWKQFDQEVNTALVNRDTEETSWIVKDICGKGSTAAVNRNTSIKDEDCKAGDREDYCENSGEREDCGESSGKREDYDNSGEREHYDESAEEFQDKERGSFVEVVSASSSHDSGFVFISDQMVRSDHSTLNPTSLDSESEGREFRKPLNPQSSPLSTSSQTQPDSLDVLSNNLPSKVIPSQQNCSNFCDNDSDDVEENNDKDDIKTEDGVDSLSNGQKQTSSVQRLVTAHPGLRPPSEQRESCMAEDVVRHLPEGVTEHLSLPAGPSPFAFSIASLVASRARHLAHVEDTFGDSSSEGEEEGGEESVS